MENDVLDCLDDLQYPGPCSEPAALTAALDGGPESAQFRQLVAWLVGQLGPLCHLEETVAAESGADDFQLELSGVLRELRCPHAPLLDGPTQARLAARPARLLLLDFLCGELQAARMLATDAPPAGPPTAETPTAAALKRALLALNFPKPPAQITPAQLFSKVEQKLGEVVRAAPPALVGTPLWSGELSQQQWRHLERIASELQHEYRLRREMLLKRLDVTVQSFRWSPRAQQRQEEVLAAFGARRAAMTREPAVQLADLLAARADLAVEERTCSSQVRRNTRTGLNRVVIGPVPDRGGRPSEQRAPPPEMPSWKPRDAGQPGGR
ncbi:protein FAM98A-like, partial [Pollicipes pollicipes]